MKALAIMTFVVGLGLVWMWTMVGANDIPPPHRIATTAGPPQQPPRAVHRASAAAVPQLARVAEPAPSPTVVPEEAPRSPERVRDALQASFSAEAVDTSWSRAATEKLARSLHAVLRDESTLAQIECRETLCRIETRHHDLGAFRTYVHDAYVEPGTDISGRGAFVGVLNEPSEGGPVVAVAYVAGRGGGLPSP